MNGIKKDCKHHKNCKNFPDKCEKCRSIREYIDYEFFEPKFGGIKEMKEFKVELTDELYEAAIKHLETINEKYDDEFIRENVMSIMMIKAFGSLCQEFNIPEETCKIKVKNLFWGKEN